MTVHIDIRDPLNESGLRFLRSMRREMRRLRTPVQISAAEAPAEGEGPSSVRLSISVH